MKKDNLWTKKSFILPAMFALLSLSACDDLMNSDSDDSNNEAAVFLLIDEESIDNGNEPNNFTEIHVNDQLADIGLRLPLQYFKDNIGRTIDLYTGQVGDEGWFAIKTIPASWKSAGPMAVGIRNYLAPGPGLGASNPDDNREVLLDKIPDVTPLRAAGIKMLEGKTVFAVVYDSDISINYSPLVGNLMGANLGVVAFEVLSVKKRENGSDSSLPVATVRIVNVEQIDQTLLALFGNPPVPSSSSEPFDVTPPPMSLAIQLKSAE